MAPSNVFRAISKNAISFFLQDTIAKAIYEDGGPVKAHDVRGMATSMAFKSAVAISSILEAATWKSSSTFSNFYFKDIAFSSKG